MSEKEKPNEELQKILDSNESLTQIFSKNMNEEEYPKSVYRSAARELAQYFNEEVIYGIFDKYLPSEYWDTLNESQRKARLHDVIEEVKTNIESKITKENKKSEVTEDKDTKKEEKDPSALPKNIHNLIAAAKESGKEGIVSCQHWIEENSLELTCIPEGYWMKQKVKNTDVYVYPNIIYLITDAFNLESSEEELVYAKLHSYNKEYWKEAIRLSNTLIELAFCELDDKNIIKTAVNELLNGDPYQYIFNTWKSLHVGDETIGKTLIACAASTYITGRNSGIHFKPSGESGKGKTSAIDAFVKLLPSSMVVRGSISNKYICYAKDEINNGSIIFMDDRKLSADLEGFVKTSISNFQEPEEHKTVIDGKPARFKPSKRLVWMFASVDGFDDEQMLNRFLMADVDCSPEQNKRVAERQRENETDRFLDNKDFEINVCKCMFELLRLRTYNIIIPYAEAITWKHERNRRNLPKFFDIIRAVCFYKALQRTRCDNFILATSEDLERAKNIYGGTSVQANTNLTTEESQILEYLSKKNLSDDNPNKEEFKQKPTMETAYRATVEEIAFELHKKPARTRQIINGLGGKIERFFDEKEAVNPHRTLYYFVGTHDFHKYEKFMGDLSEETTKKLEEEFIQKYESQKGDKIRYQTFETQMKKTLLEKALKELSQLSISADAFTSFQQAFSI